MTVHDIAPSSENPFKNERVARVQRDIFTASRGVVDLFKSVSDLAIPCNGQQALETLANKGYQRILFSNPYRSVKHLDLYRACRVSGFPYLIVERGALPNSIFLDQTGFLMDSTLYDEVYWRRPLSTKQVNSINQFKRVYFQNKIHLESQPVRRSDSEIRELKQGRRMVFIPLQVRSDTVVRFFSNGRSYEEFLKDVSALALRHRSVRFIYKPHPQDPNIEIDGAYRCDWHIDDLIHASDRIITFNSGVGILALLQNKAIATYGRAFYGKTNVVDQLIDTDDMDHFVLAQDQSVATDSQDQFLFYIINRLYSDVKFLDRPFAPKNAHKVAIKVKTARIYDPRNGYFFERSQPELSDLREYVDAIIRFLRNRVDEKFGFRHNS